MNHEVPSQPEKQPEQPNDWEAVSAPATFEELNQIANETDIPILSFLNSTNPEAKQEFLENPDLERPNNEWAKMDGPRCERNLAAITAARSRIEDADLPFKKRLLLETEYSYIAKKNNLVLATYDYNHATTPEEQRAAAERHAEANQELYGMPDKTTFYALLTQKLNQIPVKELTDEQKKMYDELLDMLGDFPRVDPSQLYQPRPETIERFGEMMHIFYEPFLQHIPDNQEIFTPEDAAEIVNEALKEEVGDTEWHAIVKPKATLASVGSEEKVINFPGARSKGNYTRKELEKIIIHELGTHALRALAVEDTPIKVFRTENFEGRETFEEGIAKVMEQSLEGRADDPDSPAPSRYIMIGLANFHHSDFRQIFEIMRRLESLTGGWNEGQIFDNLQRTFRGTGVLPNNKDLAYYNGNVRAWQFIEEHIDDPDLFESIFLAGKINSEDHDQAALSYELKTGGFER